MPDSRPQHVAVLGGGPSGLTVALELAGAGHRVTLLEATDRLGGLGTWFEWRDRAIEQFYHCQMPGDAALLRLIRSVGLIDEMYWKPTRMGMVVDGRRYPFNGALDLLRFSPLSFVDRIRFGVISLLLRPLGKGRDLDHTPIGDWLIPLYGRRIWNKILRALFLMKFGDHADQLPALYLWARMGRESNTATRGYLRGGLKRLIDTIEARLESLGAEVRYGARVERMTQEGQVASLTLSDGATVEADWVVSTLPLPTLKKATAGTPLEPRIPVPDVPYQGVVNALFFLKKPLDNFYWSAVISSGTEFDGLVEMTELVEREHYDGLHAVYALRYCGADSDLFQESDEAIAARWSRQLLGLYPDRADLSADDIVEVRVFRTPFVEPIYPLGYGDLKPPIEIDGLRVLLASSSQVYPNTTSWNASVELAYEVAARLGKRIARAGADAPRKAPAPETAGV